MAVDARPLADGLPGGWIGRGLALGLSLLVLLLVWFAAVAPLMAWYADRAEANAQRRAYAARMAELVAQVPDLQRRAASLQVGGPSTAVVLGGDTDAIAGARLQEIVQDLAGHEGITLASTETLAAVPTGRYRRIGLRISFTAPYGVLVRLMQDIIAGGDGAPRMLIDDIDIQGSRLMNKTADAPLETRMTVLAFRAESSAR